MEVQILAADPKNLANVPPLLFGALIPGVKPVEVAKHLILWGRHPQRMTDTKYRDENASVELSLVEQRVAEHEKVDLERDVRVDEIERIVRDGARLRQLWTKRLAKWRVRKRHRCNFHHRLVPPAGFEPALTAPEADALSPELRGRGAMTNVIAEGAS